MPAKYHNQLIKLAHESVGHKSVTKTIKRLTETYTWPKMRKTVTQYTSKCATCKVSNRKRIQAPMVEVKTPTMPFYTVGLDFIGPFIMADRTRYVLTAIDYLTGWAEAYPVKDMSAAEIIRTLESNFYVTHSWPANFVADNGHGFASYKLRDYLHNRGVRLVHSTPYRPAMETMFTCSTSSLQASCK